MIKLRSDLWGLILLAGALGCGSQEIQFAEAPDQPEDLNESSADALPYFAKEWQINEAEQQTVIIDTGFGLVSQGLTLQQNPLTQETISQINRPVQTVSSSQGHDGDTTNESFAVIEAGLLDLLIVIDDSDSMDPYQQKLADNLPSILTHIGNTNWRIAVATTSDPCLRQTSGGTQILTKAIYDADPAAGKDTLTELIDVPVKSSYERGILMGTDALQGICGASTNAWIRSSANVAMLIVTDEENCGSASNEGCDGDPWETASYFTDVFGTTPTVHGLLLLADPDGSDPTCDGSGGYENPPNPVNYIDLITQTGGVYDDICTSNYTNVLEQISQAVSDKINVQFELAYEPSGAVDIEIDGTPVVSYTVDGTTLTINDAVSDTAVTLEANYQHSPVSKTRFYSTNSGVDEDTLMVYMDDLLVAKDQYTYNSGTQQVEFNNLPPDRSKIDLMFRPNQVLPTEFDFSNDLISGTMNVLVDGEPASFTVDEENQKVVFAEAPRDSQTVSLQYAQPGDKTTDYDVVSSIDTEKLEEFKVFDADTNEEIPASINDEGKLVIAEDQVWDARKVKVEFNKEIDSEQLFFSLPLSNQLLAESISISADGDGDVCSQEVKVSDSSLSFNCIDEDFETLEVNYQELVDYENTFALDFDYAGPVQWKVFLNDKEFEGFHQFDKTIVVLKKNLPPGTKVRVEAHPIK